MTEALALEGGEKVLEIGAGSGYAATVLSKIAGEVYTVERIGQLAEKAASTLADLGYSNVRVLHGDGTKGWPEHAPFDPQATKNCAMPMLNPALALRQFADHRSCSARPANAGALSGINTC